MTHKISIRWQIQIWQTLLLAAIVTVLAYYLYQKEDERLRFEVDRDLGQRVVGMMRLLPHVKEKHGLPEFKSAGRSERGGGPRRVRRPNGRRHPRGGRGRPSRDREQSIPEGANNSRKRNDETIQNPKFYVAVWEKEKLVLNVRFPKDRVVPDFTPSPGGVYQTRGNFREVVGGAPQENKVLIGYNMGGLDQEMNALLWRLVGGGAGVVMVGFAVGWIATGRAVKPISEIKDVAASIADGKLNERIEIKRPAREIDSLQKELNLTFTALERSMEHQKKFTSDASHELRNPLAAMMLEIEIALAAGVEDEEARDSLSVCKRNLTEMSSLVNGLLALARLDEGQIDNERESLAIDEIILEVADRLHPMAEEVGMEIITELEPITMGIVSTHLRQIVDNLLTNALKYGKGGERVIVGLSKVGAESITISVQDFGSGIALENQEHLFERFYRVDTARSQQDGSSGIGLAIVKGLVASYGGKVAVDSELGQGSTFTVELP